MPDLLLCRLLTDFQTSFTLLFCEQIHLILAIKKLRIHSFDFCLKDFFEFSLHRIYEIIVLILNLINYQLVNIFHIVFNFLA